MAHFVRGHRRRVALTLALLMALLVACAGQPPDSPAARDPQASPAVTAEQTPGPSIGVSATGTATADPTVSTNAATGSARTSTYTNPVFDSDFPDPTVIRASDGWYYGYATQTIQDTGKILNIQVARSRDLVHWEGLGDALPVKPAWAAGTQDFWAPHVDEHEGKYYMYFSARAGAGPGMCMGAATATKPTGPFTATAQPLKCGHDFGTIDPMAFDDPQTGKRLLYWGSASEPLKVQELAPDRLSFLPNSQPEPILFPRSNTLYERLIEGAWIVERDGFYYLFYSGDNCCGPEARYAVLVARARSATGPFERLSKEIGLKSRGILERNERWNAPGHNSVIRDAAGQDWLVYHAIDTKNAWLRNNIGGSREVRRVMLIDRLVYRDGWPRVEGGTPSTTEQQAPVVP